MNLALTLATQLLFAQAGPSDVAQGDPVETDAEAITELRERMAAIEARLQELEQQQEGEAKDEEVAALKEEMGALQESTAVPGQAADYQRATRELRVRSVENALAFAAQAYRIVETGEEDVSGPVASAYAALQEGLQLALDAGSPLEAQRFEAAMRAVAAVPAALSERDFQQAMELLALTVAEGNQALMLARSTAPLPVSAP